MAIVDCDRRTANKWCTCPAALWPSPKLPSFAVCFSGRNVTLAVRPIESVTECNCVLSARRYFQRTGAPFPASPGTECEWRIHLCQAATIGDFSHFARHSAVVGEKLECCGKRDMVPAR